MIKICYEYSCFLLIPLLLGHGFLLSFVLFVIRRKITGLNTGIGPISLLFELALQTGEFMIRTRLASL